MKNPLLLLTTGLLLSGLVSTALAETTMTPKARYTADSKQAAARYAADKKLCNDETSSSARLQCRRDAQAEYNKAISKAKARLGAVVVAAKPTPANQALCAGCGKVVAVNLHEKEGEGGALGIIAGGATGAVLGHQVGGGMGKDLATIAGAVGGAYAGKKIEEKVKTRKVWAVSVRYGDGRTHSFEFAQNPDLKVGDTVRNSGNSIVRN